MGELSWLSVAEQPPRSMHSATRRVVALTVGFACLIAVIGLSVPRPAGAVAPSEIESEAGRPERSADLDLIESRPNGTNRSIIVLTDDAPAKRGLAGPDADAAASATIEAIAADADVEPTHRYLRVLRGFAAELNAAQRASLLADPGVASIEPDPLMYLDADQPDPPWGLDRIDAVANIDDDNYRYDYDGSGVHLYVVDTGINSAHDDFAGRIGNGVDIVDGDTDPEDCAGHGTHVSSTAGGTTWGVAKAVTVHPVRTFGCGGSTPSSVIIAGLEWVAANHIKPAVVNMSLGGDRSAPADSAVEALVDLGVTVVVAAGNSNTDACRQTPANEPSVITVGATDEDDARARFSNWGSCVDIFAPGTDIRGAHLGSSNATRTLNGTSMSSPHVAGVAALILDQHPMATPQQVMDLMLESSTRGLIEDPYLASPNRLLHSLNFSSVLPPTLEIQGDVRTQAGSNVEGDLAIEGVDQVDFVAFGLPDGVEMSSAGVYSGAPVAPGRFAAEVHVTAGGRTFYRRFQWHVVTGSNQAPVVQPFATEVTVLAGTDPYFWFHVNDPDLDFASIDFQSPSVSARDARDGQTPHARRLQLTDVPEGVHNISVQGFDERGGTGPVIEFRVTAVSSFPGGVNPDPGLQPQASVEAELGQPIAIRLEAIGANPNVRYGISELPPGLTFDTFIGQISGVPNAIGDFELRATISNLQGQTASLRFGLSVEVGAPPARLPSASVRTACVGEDGRIDVDLTNPNEGEQTFVVSITDEPERLTSVPGGTTVTQTYEGLDDGDYLIEATVATTIVLSATEVVSCDPPVPEAVITPSCLNEDGRIDVVVTNINSEGVVYQAKFDGRLTRAVYLAPTFESNLKVTGRRDGELLVEVFSNDELILSELVTVACDVIEEIEVVVSCLAGNGRIDVNLFNTGTAQTLYAVKIGALSERSAFIAAGYQSRVTATGRRDGRLPVIVSRNGVAESFEVVVDCDPGGLPPEPPTDGGGEVAVSVGCLGVDGRVDIYLRNVSGAAVDYSVVVGTLAPRDRTLVAAGTARVTVTGRRDGVLNIAVLRDGTEIYRSTETIACDE